MSLSTSSQDDDSSSQQDCQPRNMNKRPACQVHTAGSILRLALVITLMTTGIFLNFLGTGSPVHAASDTPSTQSETTVPTSTLSGAQKFNQLLLQLAAKYTVPTVTPSKKQTVNSQVVKPLATMGWEIFPSIAMWIVNSSPILLG